MWSWKSVVRACVGEVDRASDGLAWWRARRSFQRSGLFAALPLTGTVLEVDGDRGHWAEAAVNHIPNRRCVVVDSARARRQRVDRRVRRRKFHRVCAPSDRLPFADGAFDAAWISSLARLDDAVRERTLAEMVRVVRPGGVLVAIERASAASVRAALSRCSWQIEREVAFDELGGSRYRTFVCRRL